MKQYLLRVDSVDRIDGEAIANVSLFEGVEGLPRVASYGCSCRLLARNLDSEAPVNGSFQAGDTFRLAGGRWQRVRPE